MSHDFDNSSWQESRLLISHKFSENDRKFDETIKALDALQAELRAMSDERLVFKGKAAIVIGTGGVVAGFVGGHIIDICRFVFNFVH